MTCTAKPGLLLTSLAAAALAASCGGEGGGRVDQGLPGGDPPAVVFSCTGPVPDHATLCPGAAAGLTQDVPRTLSAACPCTAACLPVPCTFICAAGYLYSAGACTPIPPPGTVSFTDPGDGTITDDATGLTWLRDAACTEPLGGVARPGPVPWLEAPSARPRTHADGSAPGAWRLPDQDELMVLAAHLAPGHPFQRVQPGRYWTTFSTCLNVYAAVDLADGSVFDLPAASTSHVLPVRSAPAP